MPTLRRLAFATLALLSCLPALSFASSGRVTQKREVSGFHRIRIEGAVNALIREGDFSVQISADEDLQPEITTRVDGDTLVIETREHGWHPSHDDISAAISLPHFEGVAVNGAGDVQVEGVHAEAVALDLHGAGNIQFAGQARKVAVALTGTGSVSFQKGRVQTLNVTLSGAGNVKARELVTHDAAVDLRGTGSVELTADGGALALGMHGVGSIRWYGSASAVSSEADGIGTIEHG